MLFRQESNIYFRKKNPLKSWTIGLDWIKCENKNFWKHIQDYWGKPLPVYEYKL
jgi:hypothetical protein